VLVLVEHPQFRRAAANPGCRRGLPDLGLRAMAQPPTHATLVIGFDGSKRGRDALALGRLLASGFDAALVVAIVHPFDRLMAHGKLGPTPPYDFEAAAREQAYRIADEARALLSDHEVVDVRVVGASSAAEALYDLAEDLGAAAVVVGSSHRGSVGRITPGSVAEALLSGSPCPVAVAPVGFGERGAPTLVAIGVAYDESDQATHALEASEHLAARLHANLTIVAVTHDPDQREALAARLERVVREAPAPIAARADVRVGTPWDELRDAGRDLDLLICGSRRYGPMRRVLLGSVTARLVRDAACPVLVIPGGVDGPLAEGRPSPAPARSPRRGTPGCRVRSPCSSRSRSPSSTSTLEVEDALDLAVVARAGRGRAPRPRGSARPS
jgi:nucleotide-binding universal stress UspA family protein